MSLIPSFFKNSVVSIGTRNKEGHVIWTSTGFFVVRRIDQQNLRPFLITNRHVFESRNTMVIRMKEKGTENLKELDVAIIDKEGKPLYKLHHNEKIDVAVLPLNGSYIMSNNLEFPAVNIDENAMTSYELRNAGANEGSILYMLGFPMGLVNEHSSEPICRMGCVARISETQITEQQSILIDIQNFPGNSGSPIFTKPEFVSIEGTPALGKSVLLGIVHSYIPYQESLVNQQTGNIVEIRSENSGLAKAHPVEYIKEIIDLIQPLNNNV